MKIRVIVKGIISYIFAMVFSIIFGLFLDANVGWFILLTLILAPLLSVFFAWLSSRLVSVSCQMEDELLSKGDTCSMVVCVRNKSIFPTPPLAVVLTNEPGVRSENTNLIVSVMSRAKQDFEVVFKANVCGKSLVGIDTVQVTDYLGLFSFSIKKLNYASLKRNVAVIPDIAEISARDDNLVKVMQTSLHMDDGDDTVESATFSFGGFPGYDNRDYVPGDPVKRINWKQSAKRNKLLVRLDDEMASRSVNVVLDSVFKKNTVDINAVSRLQQYRDLADDEIIPKIAEDAVENALGIIRVLIQHNYTVNFYAMMGKQFSKCEIADESDLENVRLELANYSFHENEVARIPCEDLTFKEKVSLFSTPNNYEEACAALEGVENALYTTIFSVVDEARKENSDEGIISLKEFHEKQKTKSSVVQRITAAAKPLIIPYLLALLLSVSVFAVFDIPALSYWTLGQGLVCAGVMAFCEYVKKHRVIGTMLVTVLVMGLLNVSARLAFGGGASLSYMHWFVSGGESVETTVSYLLTLLLVFTVFFAMVVFYFTIVLYRTSFLLLVSLIPFVIYVKVMQDINMVQVVLITALNVAAFLMNSRIRKDKGKRIVGYISGLISVGLYAVLFMAIGLAVPETETKYYYLFENTFLGGNISEEVPEEYSTMSEYSGNADGFNELNNRKLYVISSVDTDTPLYLNRQTFDLYDFENDRWYPLEYYSEAVYSQEEWIQEQSDRSLSGLVQAMHCADRYEPGILAEYGLEEIPENYSDTSETLYVETMNFPSVAYITPPKSIKVTVQKNNNYAQRYSYISRAGIFQRIVGFLHENIEYTVEYYDEYAARNSLIASGGANYDREASLQMLTRLKAILDANGETTHARVVGRYIAEAEYAQLYEEACAENSDLIPESVRNLALEITEDCTYDWEKALALQEYFRENDFVYDLSYDAPDDSVEYFLFKGKTGTCSDYASAYVLMARSVGLVVRYVEGFVPVAEYNGDYVIRTDCGHAYPEVYIPNVGFVVYEATQPARYNATGRFGGGIAAYVVTVLFRIIVVFALVSAFIVAILFAHVIAAPYVREVFFLRKLKKATPQKAVVMLYKRIQKKYLKSVIKNAATNTPYEYAVKFEQLVEYDISELMYMVERAVYAHESLGVDDKIRAQEIYQGAKEAVKSWEKKKRKE